MQYVISLQANKTVEILEWKTDIVESEDGREQSNKVRDVPRQSFSVTAFCDNANYQETFNLLYSGMSSQWGVPTWQEAQVIPAFVGGTTIACDPSNRDFRVGHYAVLWENPKSYQVLQIASVGADSITLESSANAATNAILMPMRIGRIVGQPSRQFNGFDQYINSTFEIEDTGVLTTTAPAQFLGYDINFPETEGLKDGDRAEGAFETRNDSLDFGLGQTSNYYPWRHSRVKYPYSVVLEGQAEKQAFREWLHRRAGRYSKFWMPTWENDIRVASWSGTDFNIYDDGISETESIRKTIAIQTETGWHPRTVEFAQTPVNGILNGLLSSSFTGTIQRVCWLGLRRLESDRVEIAHITGGVAKVNLTLVEVEPNGDDEGNLLTEEGLDITTELGQPIALESASEISQLLNGSKKISDMVISTPETAAAAGAFIVTAIEDQTNNKISLADVSAWIVGIASDYTDEVMQDHVSALDPHPQYALKSDGFAHNDLSGIQGGAAGDQWHLLQTQHEGLTGGNATDLHTHNATLADNPASSTLPTTVIGTVTSKLQQIRDYLKYLLAQIGTKPDLGETSTTAYRGDRGKTAYDHSQITGNPHGTTKADVGLSNVDNTSDADKPISTATQTALNAKANNSDVWNVWSHTEGSTDAIRCPFYIEFPNQVGQYFHAQYIVEFFTTGGASANYLEGKIVLNLKNQNGVVSYNFQKVSGTLSFMERDIRVYVGSASGKAVYTFAMQSFAFNTYTFKLTTTSIKDYFFKAYHVVDWLGFAVVDSYGMSKVYQTVGADTRYAMSQNAITNELANKSPLNTLLNDNPASGVIPEITSESLVAKIQRLRDNVKYILNSWLTGAISTVLTSNLQTNRALISNSSGKIAVLSTVNDVELAQLAGITSNVQTQINGKAPTNHASSATTYGVGSSANYGHVKMYSSTGGATDGTMTQGSISSAISGVGSNSVRTPSTDVTATLTAATVTHTPVDQGNYLLHPAVDMTLTLNIDTGGIYYYSARCVSCTSSFLTINYTGADGNARTKKMTIYGDDYASFIVIRTTGSRVLIIGDNQ